LPPDNYRIYYDYYNRGIRLHNQNDNDDGVIFYERDGRLFLETSDLFGNHTKVINNDEPVFEIFAE
jgi:hypothetical protein